MRFWVGRGLERFRAAWCGPVGSGLVWFGRVWQPEQVSKLLANNILGWGEVRSGADGSGTAASGAVRFGKEA